MIDEYDAKMEQRDVTKVKHSRRIADALERIADALELGYTYEAEEETG
jgi:hypothetical protein